MISKASAEEMMQRYEGRIVIVYDGRAECNYTEGYIVAVWADCMVICGVMSDEWPSLEHSLIALNTIVEVHVYPKAE